MKIATTVLLSVTAMSAQANLIVTGVFDGPLSGGLPKVVELYAADAIADLGQYGVGAANNGGGTDGVELELSGSAAAGSFIYVADTGSTFDATVFSGYFGFSPAALFNGNFNNGGAAALNGNDAIEVFFDASKLFEGLETVIDVFGDASFDGIPAWLHTDGWAYRNDGVSPSSTFNINDWSISGTDVNDGKTTNTDPNAFPIGTYVVPEPASAALLGLGTLLISRRRRQS